MGVHPVGRRAFGARRALVFAVAGVFAALLLGLAAARAAAQDPPTPVEQPAVGKELRVLFVGNSYCSVNGLPTLLAELAQSDPRGPKIAVESVTPGGATLKQHFESTGALEKLRNGTYTHVVLQGQSLEPLANPEEFLTFAEKLAEEAVKRGSKVVFYQTWARREGSAEYRKPWSGGTTEKMQRGLSAAYAKAAASCGARVAPVGDVWSAALAVEDPPKLFDADGSHPSQAGTYLAACVFYETLTERSCLELEAQRKGLAAKDAARLRKLAHASAAK
jgi:hypothetical protein